MKSHYEAIMVSIEKYRTACLNIYMLKRSLGIAVEAPYPFYDLEKYKLRERLFK